MRHTFISWDCSFRNFHHLIDALACQDYDLSQVELLYIEQRSRAHADAYNHSAGLPSLHDRSVNESHPFLRVIHMDDPLDQPYHLGRILNTGIKEARGEIITIMDGDMLLPKDFLIELDKIHQGKPAVVNVERKMCPHPVGSTMENWHKGHFEYEACLGICPDPSHIPNYVTNKGPMISAPREAFIQAGGYDEHPMFATGLTRAGQDMNARLELATKARSVVVKRVAVHPFHPQGFSRKTIDAVRVLQVHASIINWTRKNSVINCGDRAAHLDSVYDKHRSLFRRVHEKDYSNTPFASLLKSPTLGQLYKWGLQLVRPFRP
jgi:hypothetical protein